MERSLLIFALWSVLGLLALVLYLVGMRSDSYLIALVGTGVLLTAFGGHVIINAIFDTGFTPGETALGLGVFGVIVLLFITATLFGGLSRMNFLAGLTLLGTVVIAFVTYLMTRHGLRGAFSRFHPRKRHSADGIRE
jgi:hypothetical protein